MVGVYGRARLLALAAAVAIGALAAPARAQSITVSPAGDQFAASLTSGTSLVVKQGSLMTTCSSSSFSSAVPASPANHSSGGSVQTPMSAPTFGSSTSCTENVGGFTLVRGFGGWILVFLPPPPPGDPWPIRWIIPQGGLTFTRNVFGVVCSTTVAPSGPISVQGSWTNGSGTTKARVTFNNVAVPVSNSSGGLCPTATTLTLSASYTLSDTTTPSSQITVGP